MSDVERSVFLMKELYERPMIDEIIFDTKAVMSGNIADVSNKAIEDTGEN